MSSKFKVMKPKFRLHRGTQLPWIFGYLALQTLLKHSTLAEVLALLRDLIFSVMTYYPV